MRTQDSGNRSESANHGEPVVGYVPPAEAAHNVLEGNEGQGIRPNDSCTSSRDRAEQDGVSPRALEVR